MLRSHGRPSRVKCYDCHAFVEDLRTHRAECGSSRKSKALMASRTYAQPSARAAGGTGKRHGPGNLKDGITMFMLLDVSGSMEGPKLTAGKQALLECFASMRDEDRFAICTFDDAAFYKLKPRPVEELRRKGDEPTNTLGRIFARGQTALYDAILLTLEQIRHKDLPNHITVLTDGEDNASKRATMETVIATLQSPEYARVTLHIVHIDGAGLRSPAYQRIASEVGAARVSYEVVERVEEVVTTVVRTFTRVYTAASP